jgi:hypothetical protein
MVHIQIAISLAILRAHTDHQTLLAVLVSMLEFRYHRYYQLDLDHLRIVPN